jgi:plastocyanin
MFEMRIPLRRGALLALTLGIALALAACGGGDGNGGNGNGGDGNGGGGTATVSGGTVEISADDLEFDVATIEAPAGEAFTVVFTNEEAAQHNFAVYTEEGGDVIVQGDFIGEGETDEVEVPALDPGEYFFVCDVHPDMTGSVVVGE